MWRSAVIGGLFLGAPAVAQAQEMSLSFGATIASEYVSSGVRYSDGPVVQPYIELGFGGLYAGAYASNLDATLTSADMEYGLSLGYRGEAGQLSYDIGVAYYLYDEAFAGVPVEDYSEAYVSASVAVSETFYVTADAAIAPEYDQTNLSLRADYYTPVEGLSVGALVGHLDSNYGSWTYWSLDATYAVSEAVSFGIAYHDTNLDPALGLADTDGLFVASMSIAF
jgi:uncharacterized protein (TIGR02001 family)